MNAEQTMLQKFSRILYELNTSIRHTICLRLLNDDGGSSLETLEELLEDTPLAEIATLFGIEEDYLDENGGAAPVIVDQKRGWVVYALVGKPMESTFTEEGQVISSYYYGFNFPRMGYGETLEEALGKVVALARESRLEAFNKARKEKGLPILTVEQCKRCNFGMEEVEA